MTWLSGTCIMSLMSYDVAEWTMYKDTKVIGCG